MPGSPDLALNLSKHEMLGHALTMMAECDKYHKDIGKKGDREDIIKTDIYTCNRESILVDALLLRWTDNTCLAEIYRCW
jgi:hypothetical protein